MDFPEDGYHFVDPLGIGAARRDLARNDGDLVLGRRGRLIREGLTVAIVGKPNVGKSSVFNALVGAHRAIVTAVPGTTEISVVKRSTSAGLRVTLVDTAGLRDTIDIVELEGVSRSVGATGVADVVLVCDPIGPHWTSRCRR